MVARARTKNRSAGGRVLLVEDDRDLRQSLCGALRQAGHVVGAAGCAEQARGAAITFKPDVVVTDLHYDGAGLTGLELLDEIKGWNSSIQVIVTTAAGSLETALAAVRGGAFACMGKPVDFGELCTLVHRAVGARSTGRRPRAPVTPDGTLIGSSPNMMRIFQSIAQVAPHHASVLISGETGTGKELVARAIHDASLRRDRAYITINCASLPEGLLESELFGHAQGAFTGATESRKGLFEAADRGTILLDEIGDMPLGVQAKLLRVLESREIRPVGCTRTRRVDVRILAATHRDLEAAVREGEFREDLYYRLQVVSIRIPPLRERPGDLDRLTRYFLDRHAAGAGRPALRVCDEALELMQRYPWRGNVRELSHVVERFVALCQGSEVTVEDLPANIRDHAADRESAVPTRTLAQVEEEYILQVLRSVEGNRSRAAAVLGIDRKSLYRKLMKFAWGRDGA